MLHIKQIIIRMIKFNQMNQTVIMSWLRILNKNVSKNLY